MNALIVDDSQLIRRIVRVGLEELGVGEIIEAESADQALKIVQMITYIDIILTDWHMPGMNGLEFLKTLRADSRFKQTPIVMTTSESAGENIIAALQAGATTYLIKPFSRHQFNEKIGPLLRYSRSAAESAATMLAVTQSGKVNDGDLGSILQFLTLSGKTGCCELISNDAQGQIYFASGRIAGARFKQELREAAFFACFNSPLSRYRFKEGAIEVPPDCAITMSTTALLLEAAAKRDTMNSV